MALNGSESGSEDEEWKNLLNLGNIKLGFEVKKQKLDECLDQASSSMTGWPDIRPFLESGIRQG